MGLLVLFAAAYGVLLALMVGGVLWQMNRPRRKTLGVSLAMGGPGDPADLEMIGREVTFNLADATGSPGWIIDGRRADGPVAVVVHGHRDSRYGSLYRAQMLLPYTSAVVVFDLPGHGDAEAGSCRMGGREARDVWAVIQGLDRDWLGGRPIVLLGYSMGAVIAVKAAAEGPDDDDAPALSGLIACAPYRFWDEGLRGQMARRSLPQFPAVALVGLALSIAAKLDPRGWGLGLAPGFDVAAWAGKVDIPTLVLHGDADRICPLSAGRAVADAAPLGRLVVIPGGTHNQLLAAGYDQVHEALAGFFADLGANPARDPDNVSHPSA